MKQVHSRVATATLSALVADAVQGEASVITGHGKPQAVIVGIDEWNCLRSVPSFGWLLASMPLEDEDLPPRDPTPLRNPGL